MVRSWVGPTRRDRGATPSHVGQTHRVLAAHSEVVQREGPLEPTLRAGAGARREPAWLCPLWGDTLCRGAGGRMSRPLSQAKGPFEQAPESSGQRRAVCPHRCPGLGGWVSWSWHRGRPEGAGQRGENHMY